MCCEANFEDLAKATHLKCLEATDLCDAGGPAFRAVEECWEGGCLGDSDFGSEGYFWAIVEDGFEAPETV